MASACERGARGPRAGLGGSAPPHRAGLLASAVEPMDFFPGSVDGLDDDVGLVDADVFDMLLCAEQAGHVGPR